MSNIERQADCARLGTGSSTGLQRADFAPALILLSIRETEDNPRMSQIQNRAAEAARIDAREAAVRAWVTVTQDGALDRARTATAELRAGRDAARSARVSARYRLAPAPSRRLETGELRR